MNNVIIYARVSTREQNVDMQITDLRQYAEARKLKIVREYIDYASGAKCIIHYFTVARQGRN